MALNIDGGEGGRLLERSRLRHVLTVSDSFGVVDKSVKGFREVVHRENVFDCVSETLVIDGGRGLRRST